MSWQFISKGDKDHGRIFRRDRRWVESLGPQRLTHDSMTPADAFDLVPVEVWWQTLASVIRMFPGIGPDSTCRDWADARLHGLHRVFEQPARDLETLLIKTRSLIVIDWRFNREIHAVIRRLTTGLTPG